MTSEYYNRPEHFARTREEERYGPRYDILPPNVEPVRNSNYGYAADGYPPRVYTDGSRGGPLKSVLVPQQHYQTGYDGAAGYDDQYSDYNNTNGLYRPHGNNIMRNDYDDHYSRKHHDDKYTRKQDAGLLGPIVLPGGNKHKTSRSTWGPSGLPVRGDGRLSVPTDDMERALHYLRESAKSRK